MDHNPEQPNPRWPTQPAINPSTPRTQGDTKPSAINPRRQGHAPSTRRPPPSAPHALNPACQNHRRWPTRRRASIMPVHHARPYRPRHNDHHQHGTGRCAHTAPVPSPPRVHAPGGPSRHLPALESSRRPRAGRPLTRTGDEAAHQARCPHPLPSSPSPRTRHAQAHPC